VRSKAGSIGRVRTARRTRSPAPPGIGQGRADGAEILQNLYGEPLPRKVVRGWRRLGRDRDTGGAEGLPHPVDEGRISRKIRLVD
jgi:hypothetical protein